MKNYTVFITTDDQKDSIKEWRFSSFWFRIVAVGLGCVFLLLSAFALDYFLVFGARLGYQQQLTENRELKNYLTQVVGKMEQLKSRLNQIEDFTHKLKVLAGLKNSLDSTFTPIAIGPLSNPSVTQETVMQLSVPKKDNLSSIPVLGMMNPDSIVVYMEGLDRKSRLVRQDVHSLMRSIYERRDIISSTPSIMPVKGWMSSQFGYRKYPFTSEISIHEGVDIAALSGTPVYSPSNGVVIFSGYKTGYGKVITIDHGYQLSTLYAHLSESMVSAGVKVKRGEVIGTIGNTGYSSGPHLHYEVRIANVPVNPNNYMLDNN